MSVYQCQCHTRRATGQNILIRYGKTTRWRILLTTDTRLSFVEDFELYQIRWNIEVLNKESKQYLGLGGAQSRDFDAWIADAILCFITYIIMEKTECFLSVFSALWIKLSTLEYIGQHKENIVVSEKYRNREPAHAKQAGQLLTENGYSQWR